MFHFMINTRALVRTSVLKYPYSDTAIMTIFFMETSGEDRSAKAAYLFRGKRKLMQRKCNPMHELLGGFKACLVPPMAILHTLLLPHELYIHRQTVCLSTVRKHMFKKHRQWLYVFRRCIFSDSCIQVFFY